MPSKLFFPIGYRSGSLVVDGTIRKSKHGKIQWFCLCDCGGEAWVDASVLKAKKQRFCQYCGLRRRRIPERGCCVEGCDRKHRCKGYCSLHYYRIRSKGPVRKPYPEGTERVHGGCVVVKNSGHSYATKYGWVKKSRLYLESVLGGEVSKGDRLKFIDGDNLNWSSDNLVVVTADSVHSYLCKNCGKAFQAPQAWRRKGEAVFCSKLCGNRFRRIFSDVLCLELRAVIACGMSYHEAARRIGTSANRIHRAVTKGYCDLPFLQKGESTHDFLERVAEAVGRIRKGDSRECVEGF